jgi:death-on-curing protein
MAQSGGAEGLIHLPALESALAQPQMAFGGEELYPTLVDKAAAFGYALLKNHPFSTGTNAQGMPRWKSS